MQTDFNTVKKVYFIGIGGIGMSAVARMFLFEGKSVSGSDLAESEITRELAVHGAIINIGNPSDALPADADLVIYTVAIPDTHPELVAARAKGIPTMTYPESLAVISRDKFTIAVAGTHGKTTTTGMVATVMIEGGLDPTVVVGSLIKKPGTNASLGATSDADTRSNFIAGKSEFFVVEACEYKRSFLNLHPNIAIITNIDDDHLDYYKDMAGIQRGFGEFVCQIKAGGVLVTDLSNTRVTEMLNLPEVQSHLLTNDIQVLDYASIQPAQSGDQFSHIPLLIPGAHNQSNARAALVVAGLLGVDQQKVLDALATFPGTWRRFESKGQTANGVLVYDDYAHHPSEITATLAGAREKFPKQHIVVAYQPHLFSRTKEHFNEFGRAFRAADQIIILPIYAAREPADPTVSGELLAQKIAEEIGVERVRFLPDFGAVTDFVTKHLGANDVFFTMGAGDVNKISELVLPK